MLTSTSALCPKQQHIFQDEVDGAPSKKQYQEQNNNQRRVWRSNAPRLSLNTDHVLANKPKMHTLFFKTSRGEKLNWAPRFPLLCDFVKCTSFHPRKILLQLKALEVLAGLSKWLHISCYIISNWPKPPKACCKRSKSSISHTWGVSSCAKGKWTARKRRPKQLRVPF